MKPTFNLYSLLLLFSLHTGVGVNAAEPPTASEFSVELTHLFVGLIQQANMYPEKGDAVRLLAASNGWKETPEAKNALFNTKFGYVGRVSGTTVLIGTDGANGIFGIAAIEGFEPTQIATLMESFVKLEPRGSETSMGQKFEVYEMIDGSSSVGLFSLTYGTADTIRGGGSMGYISAERARETLNR